MSPRKNSSRKNDGTRYRHSKLAVLSVVLLLCNVFVWATFWGGDRLLVSLASTVIGLLGYITGTKALKKIQHRHGVLQGDGPATVGKWANMGIFILAGMYFCWTFAMAIYSGRII